MNNILINKKIISSLVNKRGIIDAYIDVEEEEEYVKITVNNLIVSIDLSEDEPFFTINYELNGEADDFKPLRLTESTSFFLLISDITGLYRNPRS